jgi:putative endonuclease
MEEIGYVYILRSESSCKYYLGSTNNPDRRLSQHNGNAVKATRGKGPWIRVKLITFKTEAMARSAEQFIKKLKSKRLIQSIVDGSFVWPADFRPL